MNEIKKFKTQVLTRSFYEDAYLSFFIKYYLDLGFDRIVIFKADKEELGEFTLDFLSSEKGYTEIDKERVIIKYVENEGNGIYSNPDNFPYYIDTTYDWSLHVDVDEFLVINRDKYAKIHDYIIDLHNIMGVKMNELYNVKFRWLCINKLNDRWGDDGDDSGNNCVIGSFKDYVDTNKLEIYSFVKGLYQTSKVIDDREKMDAHIVKFKDVITEKGKLKGTPNCIVIDNTFTLVNKYKSPLFGSNSNPEKNYCNGFILHFNTRSYSNSLTKCLVTQLRDNKKISDLQGFRKFINGINIDDVFNAKADINTTKADKLRNSYTCYLNSKRFFPKKIAELHNKYSYLVPEENYLSQIKTVVNNNPELICKDVFINLEREREILAGLCKKFDINYDNLQAILSLF